MPNQHFGVATIGKHRAKKFAHIRGILHDKNIKHPIASCFIIRLQSENVYSQDHFSKAPILQPCKGRRTDHASLSALIITYKNNTTINKYKLYALILLLKYNRLDFLYKGDFFTNI